MPRGGRFILFNFSEKKPFSAVFRKRQGTLINLLLSVPFWFSNTSATLFIADFD